MSGPDWPRLAADDPEPFRVEPSTPAGFPLLPPAPPPPPSPPAPPEEPTELPPDPPGPEPAPHLGVAIAAGFGAALAGGLAWGLIAKTTGYEFRAAAVVVGLAVGLAIRAAAGGRDSAGLHVLAAVATVCGIVLGKYLTFAFVMSDAIQEVAPVRPSVSQPSALSSDMVRLFLDNIGLVFGRLDLVWFVGAIGVALLVLVPGEPAKAAPATRPRPPSHNPVDRFTRGLPEPIRVVADWVITIVGAVAIVLLVKAYAVNPYRIPSSSMEPTLHCAAPASGCEAKFSDRVLANRFVYHLRDPRRGDIVVFNTPPAALAKCGADGTFVKRLIGLPGEKIEVRLIEGAGYVFINGKRLREPYVEKGRRGAEPYGPTKIAKNHYFMMGDNRSQSCDSRAWGAVPRANIIGKVFATYWPPNRLHLH